MRDGGSGTWLRGGKGILGWGGAAYLALLPLGSFWVLPVGGVRATGSDLLLGLLLLLGAVTLVRSPGFRATVGRGLAGGWRAVRFSGSGSPADDVGACLLLLAAFGVWAASSGLWGFDPIYALTRGAGYLALALAAGAVVWSGIEWDRALGAWLLGAFLTVVLSSVLAGVAAAGDGGGLRWADRVLYDGGSLMELSVRRLRGPFAYPAAFGDFLVISGALLWGWWPSGTRAQSPTGAWMARTGAFLLVVALVLSPSSAWAAGGVLLLLWGRRIGSGGGGGPASLPGLVLRGVGAVVAATTFAALVFPLRIGRGDFQVVSSGSAVRIWEQALRSFLSSPLVGVGATPALSDAVDPAVPSAGLQLRGAHGAYLGVLAQFGVVGFALTGGAAFFLVRGLLRARVAGGTGGAVGPGGSRGRVLRPGEEAFSRPPVPGGSEARRLGRLRERARKGVLAAGLAAGIHGLVVPGQDFRHWWMLVALAGLMVGVEGEGDGTP